MFLSYGGYIIPYSVIIAVTYLGGVMSKTGLYTGASGSVIRTSLIFLTSSGCLSSIVTWSIVLSRSNVDFGAAT